MPLAPFEVALLSLQPGDGEVAGVAERLYADLTGAGLEVLYDDRDERPGVKFKDADLLGVPVRVTVGNALAKDGVVEIKERPAPRREQRIAPGAVVDTIRSLDVFRSLAR